MNGTPTTDITSLCIILVRSRYTSIVCTCFPILRNVNLVSVRVLVVWD